MEGRAPDPEVLRSTIAASWEKDVLATLCAYTTIPCLSPAFDAGWHEAGHLEEATELLATWCRERPIAGLGVEVHRIEGRTPLLLVDVEGNGPPGTVLVYGHLDKQPPQGAWREGLGPYRPVRQGERLYGRGTADDGYSVFAALSALLALDSAGVPRPRVTVLIEASEESASPDLDAHLAALGPRLGSPDLVVCLDSGCLTYDRLWLTASLRGCLVATVGVHVLEEGVHSGLAGGVVASSFRILRQLLSRIEDEATGQVHLAELCAPVPETQRRALEAAAELAGPAAEQLPTVEGLHLLGQDEADRLIARAWAPAVALTGMDGIPPTAEAGNVLRPFTRARLSVRLPPSVDAGPAAEALGAALSADPPYGARVEVQLEQAAPGWLAPDPPPWVGQALERASVAAFGRPPASYGEGGTIPFLPTLSARFPDAQFVATGVLGPGSNAHGPNEFLHLPMAEAVTLALAELVAAAGARA